MVLRYLTDAGATCDSANIRF